MNAVHEYDDLHQLVDRLTPVQVRRLRLLISQDDELAEVAASLPSEAAEPTAAPDGLLSLIGSIDGPVDLGERHDHHVSAPLHVAAFTLVP